MENANMKNGSGMECRRDGEILQKMELNGKRNETLCSERGSNDSGVIGLQDWFKPRKLIQRTGAILRAVAGKFARIS
jgi:hypothetical protein